MYGFLIISSGGVPIIVREIKPRFFLELGFIESEKASDRVTKKGSLVSSLITAISDFSKEIFGEKELSFIVGGIKANIRRVKSFLVCIFSRPEEENVSRFFVSIERVLKEIGYSEEELEVDWNKRFRLLKKLDVEILGKPFPKDKLIDIIEFIQNTIQKRDSNKFFEETQTNFNEFDLEALNLIEKPSRFQDFGKLLDMFYKEKFWDILMNLVALDKDKPNILYKTFLVAIALLLRTMHPTLLAPKLESLFKLVDDIEDDTLKQILRLHLELFNSSNKLEDLINYSSVLMDKLEKNVRNPYLAHLYEILSILRLSHSYILKGEIANKLHTSHIISMLNSMYSMLFNAISDTPIEREIYINTYLRLSNKIKTNKHNLHDLTEYIFYVLKIPAVKDLSEIERNSILKEALSNLTKLDYEELLNRDDLTNTYKGLLIFAISNLFHIQPEAFKEHTWDKIGFFKKLFKSFLKWSIKINNLKRDTKPNIHLYLSSLLSAYTTLLSIEKDSSATSYLNLVAKLVKDEFEYLWYINKMLYLETYINYLIIAGNIALSLKDTKAQEKVFREIRVELVTLLNELIKNENFISEKARKYLSRFTKVQQLS